MSQQVNLGRQGFVAIPYRNTIDTSFSQLLPPPPPVEETVTVQQFFNFYDQLFYEIPAEGTVNTHQVLIQRSTEYIGFTEEKDQDIQVLLDEITSLREELLATQVELRNAQLSGSLPSNFGEIQDGTQITGNPSSTPSDPPLGLDGQGNTVSRTG